MAAKCFGTLVLGVALLGSMGCQDLDKPSTTPTAGGSAVVASDEDATVRQQRIDDLKAAVDAAIKKSASSD